MDALKAIKRIEHHHSKILEAVGENYTRELVTVLECRVSYCADTVVYNDLSEILHIVERICAHLSCITAYVNRCDLFIFGKRIVTYRHIDVKRSIGAASNALNDSVADKKSLALSHKVLRTLKSALALTVEKIVLVGDLQNVIIKRLKPLKASLCKIGRFDHQPILADKLYSREVTYVVDIAHVKFEINAERICLKCSYFYRRSFVRLAGGIVDLLILNSTRAVLHIVLISYLDFIFITRHEILNKIGILNADVLPRISVKELDLEYLSELVFVHGADREGQPCVVLFGRADDNAWLCVFFCFGFDLANNSLFTVSVVEIVNVGHNDLVSVICQKALKHTLVGRNSCSDVTVLVNDLQASHLSDFARVGLRDLNAYRMFSRLSVQKKDRRDLVLLGNEGLFYLFGLTEIIVFNDDRIFGVRKKISHRLFVHVNIADLISVLPKRDSLGCFILKEVAPTQIKIEILVAYRKVLKCNYRVGLYRALFENIKRSSLSVKRVVDSDDCVLIYLIGIKVFKEHLLFFSYLDRSLRNYVLAVVKDGKNVVLFGGYKRMGIAYGRAEGYMRMSYDLITQLCIGLIFGINPHRDRLVTFHTYVLYVGAVNVFYCVYRVFHKS